MLKVSSSVFLKMVFVLQLRSHCRQQTSPYDKSVPICSSRGLPFGSIQLCRLPVDRPEAEVVRPRTVSLITTPYSIGLSAITGFYSSTDCLIILRHICGRQRHVVQRTTSGSYPSEGLDTVNRASSQPSGLAVWSFDDLTITTCRQK
jgi:hypothetical protein